MKDELNRVGIGKRIRAARESLNLSRESFAELVPMSPSFLQDVEGGTKCLSLSKFYRVMQVLDVSADYLLREDANSISEDEERRIIFEMIREDMSRCDTQSLKVLANVVRAFTFSQNEENKEE